MPTVYLFLSAFLISFVAAAFILGKLSVLKAWSMAADVEYNQLTKEYQLTKMEIDLCDREIELRRKQIQDTSRIMTLIVIVMLICALFLLLNDDK